MIKIAFYTAGYWQTVADGRIRVRKNGPIYNRVFSSGAKAKIYKQP